MPHTEPHWAAVVALLLWEIGLLIASLPLLGTRHARNCPPLPTMAGGLSPDDFSDLWIGIWCLYVCGQTLLGVKTLTDWQERIHRYKGYVVAAPMLLSMRAAQAVGHLPGCPRLLVSCAGCLSISMLMYRHMSR